MAESTLSYEEVLEYLGDRGGDPVTVSSYPTFGSQSPGLAGPPTMLGLTLSAHMGPVVEVPLAYAEFVAGRAAVRISLEQEGPDGTLNSGVDDGLVLAREWFAGAWLSNASNLRIVVPADHDRPPLVPPVGEEGDPDAKRDVGLHELVGWGFAFDFDGSPPFAGRWALEGVS